MTGPDLGPGRDEVVGEAEDPPGVQPGTVSAKLGRCISFSYMRARVGWGVRQSNCGNLKSR